jgi:3-(3-hydroxy-phenyl)propionate hydroxylase
MTGSTTAENSTDRYDVAIVGYGPTGATAANILGQAGLKVLLLERDADIYGRARAISTDDEVLRIWQSTGLADSIQETLLPGGPVAFVRADGSPILEVSAPTRPCAHPAQQFIYQPQVDTTLRAGVGRFPNVDIRTGIEVLKVVNHQATLGGAPDVEVLAANLADDSFLRFRASWVIAADGGSSAIRGQLGVGYSGRTFQERWVVIDTKVLRDWKGSSRLRFHCNPDRPTVDCPTPMGHHRWEFPVRPGEDEKELSTHASIWRILAGQGITPDDVEILRAVVYSHHVRVADRWRIGRVFLAGDAAHAMPPWIGQGMASGARDALNLCWKLIDVIDGALPESALDTYQTEREPHVRETTSRASFVGRVITEHNHVLAKARNLVFPVANRIRPVRDTLLHSKWVPWPYFRTGLFAGGKGMTGWKHLESLRHIEAVRTVAARARGRQIIQAEVTDADGHTVRLDDALGWGWRTLTTDPGVRDASGADGTREAATVLLLPAGSAPRPGALVDASGKLTSWLADHGAATVVLRPDRFIWDAAPAGQVPEPAPLTGTPRQIAVTPAPTDIPVAV